MKPAPTTAKQNIYGNTGEPSQIDPPSFLRFIEMLDMTLPKSQLRRTASPRREIEMAQDQLLVRPRSLLCKHLCSQAESQCLRHFGLCRAADVTVAAVLPKVWVLGKVTLEVLSRLCNHRFQAPELQWRGCLDWGRCLVHQKWLLGLGLGSATTVRSRLL